MSNIHGVIRVCIRFPDVLTAKEFRLPIVRYSLLGSHDTEKSRFLGDEYTRQPTEVGELGRPDSLVYLAPTIF